MDLFFVISGFLITGILVNSRDRANYFKNFYVRRALRIWPLYYLVVLGCFFIYRFHLILGPPPQRPVWVYALFLQNIIGPQGVAPRSLLVTWSLGVEEQFYLVWPLLCWRTPKRVLAWICIFLVIAAPVCRLFVIQHGWDGNRVRAFPLCCFDGLAGGAFLALWIRSRYATRANLKRLSLICVFTGIPLFAVLDHASDLSAGWIFSFSCLGIAFTGLVALALWEAGNLFALRPLRFVGSISYGLYLYHSLVLAVIARFSLAENLRTIVALVVSLLVATVSFQVLEKPILSLKERFAPSIPPAVSLPTHDQYPQPTFDAH